MVQECYLEQDICVRVKEVLVIKKKKRVKVYP